LVPLARHRTGVKNGRGTVRDVVAFLVRLRPRISLTLGLRSRLHPHACGRRSGDQFYIYVFDRLVLPTPTRQQIEGAAHDQLSVNGLTRQLIRHALSAGSPWSRTPRPPALWNDRSSAKGSQASNNPGCGARIWRTLIATDLDHAAILPGAYWRRISEAGGVPGCAGTRDVKSLASSSCPVRARSGEPWRRLTVTRG
jgi:hypothetical protein